MNNKNSHANRPVQHRRGFSMLGLTMAAVLGVCGAAASGGVDAQATSGTIFGNVPAGDTVVAKNLSNGLQREVKADEKGRYRLRALPVGNYNMVLEKDGKAILQRLNVPVVVGRGIKVDFDCEKYSCSGH